MERKAAERSSEKVWTCTTTHWLSSSVKYYISLGNFFLGDSFGTNDAWPSFMYENLMCYHNVCYSSMAECCSVILPVGEG